MDQHGPDTAVEIIRLALIEAASAALDAATFDKTIASAIRPAGLLWNIADIGATAGGGITAMLTDDESAIVSGDLASFLALMHICGPDAPGNGPQPDIRSDPFSAWSATGPSLKQVLVREPEAIVCPELHTRYPRRVA